LRPEAAARDVGALEIGTVLPQPPQLAVVHRGPARIVAVGLVEAELSAHRRAELLQHGALEVDDEHALRVVLCERKALDGAMLEDHQAVDVGLEP
jgi:hypothetical protein